MVTTLGEPDLTISYNDDGSRRNEVYDGGADLHRAYYYDGLGRPAGLTTISTVDSVNEVVTDVGSCQYDPLGRQVQPCDGALPLGLDGENILRGNNWSIVSGPGLDDPLVALARGTTVTSRELFYITDGQGRHLTAAETDGSIAGDIVNGGGQYDGWQATGAAGGTAYGADRLSRPEAPGLAFYRNRIYDQRTGRWTQEDPLGVAGGLNLYQFNGNDPVGYSDPFGIRPCSEVRKQISRNINAQAKRVRQYREAAEQGESTAGHRLRIDGARREYGKLMEEYKNEGCYDDDDHDAFRNKLRQGEQLQHFVLPAPAKQTTKDGRPFSWPMRPVTVPAPTPEQVGTMGLLGTVLVILLLSPVGM